MFGEPNDEVVPIKAFFVDVVEDEQSRRDVFFFARVNDLEIVFVVEDMEVFEDIFVGEGVACKSDQLVKNRECVPKSAICLECNLVQGLWVGGYFFFGGNFAQVIGDVFDADSLKIENLAPR